MVQSAVFVLMSGSQLVGSAAVPGGEPKRVTRNEGDCHAMALGRPPSHDLTPRACGICRPCVPSPHQSGQRATLEARVYAGFGSSFLFSRWLTELGYCLPEMEDAFQE